MSDFDQFRDENPYTAPQEYVLAEVADEAEGSGCLAAAIVIGGVVLGILSIVGFLSYLLTRVST